MLLSACETDLAPDRFLRAACSIFATFDQETQDSGNVAYGVETPGERFFVKTAGALDDTRAPLPYEERVELLRNAIRFARKFSHPALVPLRLSSASANCRCRSGSQHSIDSSTCTGRSRARAGLPSTSTMVH